MGDGIRRSNGKGSIQNAKIFVSAAKLRPPWTRGSLPDEKGHSIAPTSLVVKFFPNKGRARMLLRHCCHNDYRYDATPNYKEKAC